MIIPTRYWMPTTLWSSEYRKYRATPPKASSSSSATGTGLPTIWRPRSLNTPSPASQPITATTYPRTSGKSFMSDSAFRA